MKAVKIDPLEEALAEDASADNDDVLRMPLVSHLLELRRRLMISFCTLIVASCVCYFFAENIYGFLVQPLADALGGSGRRLIYTGLAEAFFTYLQISVFAGAFLSFPIIATQVWMFIAPGLYKNEKKAFFPFLVATPILFVMGAALAYYGVFPLAWKFFVSFETTTTALPIQLEARVGEYLSLVMSVIFAFGLCFQLPVVLTLMGRAGLISSQALAGKRKYAIVLIFLVAAILTPPDIISQVSLAIPMLALYEISVLLVKSAEKSRASKAPAGN